MPTTTNPSQIVAKNITAFLCIGALAWLFLLLRSASRFRSASMSSYTLLHLGPLALNTFSRHAVTHGQHISISLESGLLVYALLITMAGLLTGLYQIKIKCK